MKTFLLFVSLFIFQDIVIAQPLSFSDIGYAPAYCRLFAYQSGNGVVYAAATGGTAPYTYLWENMTTGATTTNGTWGGLNVGEYVIIVTDDIGTVITDTIFLDSLNPAAAIGVIAPGLTQAGEHFYGSAPIFVEFENNSQYFANPNDPTADTTFFWRMTQFSSWNLMQDVNPNQTYNYNYGGNWSVNLVALNKNGCSDTAVVRLHLSGVADVKEDEQSGFSVTVNSEQRQVIVESSQPLNGEEIRIYNLAGQMIHTENLNAAKTFIQLDVSEGMYLYEIIQPGSDQVSPSGKIVFR